MMNKIKISVIIPVYNSAKYLNECLDSVLKQTLKEIEIICIDDGSNDGSGLLLREYAERDERIVLFSQTNKGLSATRNAGIQAARGKYVYYLDSDDYIELDTLQTLFDIMEEKELDILLFNAKLFSDADVDEKRLKSEIGYFTRIHNYPLTYKGETLFSLLVNNKEYIAPVVLQIIKRDFLLKNELYFYKGILHEDELYTFKALLLATKVGYLSSHFYCRRVHNHSIMNLDEPEKLLLSVYSCLVCLREMICFTYSTQIQPNNQPAVWKKIEIMANISRSRYNLLDDERRKKLWILTGSEQLFFKLLLFDYPMINEKLYEYSKLVNKQTETDNSLSQPCISVVIPVYNDAEYLPLCLESVIHQTLSNIEIICIEDGSEDESRKILTSYSVKDERIKILYHDKNLGTSVARKHGALFASGKYIMFLDSDDEYELSACEIAYRAIENNQTDVTKFGMLLLNSKDPGKQKGFLSSNLEKLEGNNLLELWYMDKIKGWNVTNRIYRAELCKKAYQQVEDLYIVMGEDVYYSFVHGYYAKSYSEISETLYKYRRGVGSRSSIEGKIDLTAYKRILSEKIAVDAALRFIEAQPDNDAALKKIQIKLYNLFLKQHISAWNSMLQENDKEEGYIAFEETWGVNGAAFAVKYLSEIVRTDSFKLKKQFESKRNEMECVIAKLEKEKNEINKEKEEKLSEITRLTSEMEYAKKELGENTEEFRKLKLSARKKDIKNANNLKQLREQQKRIRKLVRELDNVKNGWSFRLGRMVTWFPRKIRDGIRWRKKYGTVSLKSEPTVDPYAFIRVKNESITLKASLNSILPVIKKGVIAYNDCTDGSDLIIQDFCKKNPGFIPFHYPYHVVGQNHPDYATGKIPYKNTLAAYYNAALALIPQKSWLIKIDCDQIYFPNILKKSFSLPKNNYEVVVYSRLDLIRHNNSVKVIEYKRPEDHWLIYNNNLKFINRYGHYKNGDYYAWEFLVIPEEYKILYRPECSSLHFPMEKSYRKITLEKDKLLTLEQFRKIANPKEIAPELLEDKVINQIISSFEY